MADPPRIAVIGSVNLDLVARAERLPVAGETVTGAVLERFPGGKGANQALAARRLGAEVMLFACVGNDANADEALALLRADGVDLSGLAVCEGAATGVALIAVGQNGENQIVVAPGANRRVTAGHIGAPDADALICQLEVPPDELADVAGRFAGLVCVNLAPAMDVPDALLERADVFVVNETEAKFYGPRLERDSALLARTLGAAGAELSRGGRIVARSTAPAVQVVDTTGAGDTFTAALALALVEGRPEQAALDFACAAGAAAVSAAGAQPSLPTRAAVEALLAAR